MYLLRILSSHGATYIYTLYVMYFSSIADYQNKDLKEMKKEKEREPDRER